MDALVTFCKALSDPNRVRIIALLLEGGELCVCDIERVLGIPQARVSRHLSILRHARLVSPRRNGQWMHYSLVRDQAFVKTFYRHLCTLIPEDPMLARDRDTLRHAHTPCVKP